MELLSPSNTILLVPTVRMPVILALPCTRSAVLPIPIVTVPIPLEEPNVAIPEELILLTAILGLPVSPCATVAIPDDVEYVAIPADVEYVAIPDDVEYVAIPADVEYVAIPADVAYVADDALPLKEDAVTTPETFI